MLALRLGVKLAVGSGGSGRARQWLAATGVAFAVLAVLLTLAVPRFLSAQQARASDRLPGAAQDENNPAFRYSVVEDSVGDRLWLSVLYAEATSAATVPPGARGFPGPGEALVSPALRALLSAEPTLNARLPAKVTGDICIAGLTDPDELVSYVGVLRQDLRDGGTPGRGFGAAAPAPTAVSSTLLLLELGLLVGLPALVYLATCSRLASATRFRRLASLRLLGVPSRTVVAAAAVESAIAGLLGGLLGAALYWATNPLLASSGWFGMRWFAEDARVGPLGVATVALAAAAGVARLGVVGTRKAMANPLGTLLEPDTGHGSAWRLLPLPAGLALLVPQVVVHLGNSRARTTGLSTLLLLLGAVLSVAGLLLAQRPATHLLVGRLTGDRVPLAVRMAAKRLLFEPGSANRVLTGLVLLVVLAGVAPAILRDAELATGARANQETMTVVAGEVPARNRRALLDLPASARVDILRSQVDPGPSNVVGRQPTDAELVRLLGVDTVFGSCDDFRTLLAAQARDCRDGTSYRLADIGSDSAQPQLPAGTALSYEDTSYRLVAPDEVLRVSGLARSRLPSFSVLVTAPWPDAEALPDSTNITFVVPADGERLGALVTAARSLAPGAVLQTESRDLAALRAYEVHRAVIFLGILLGAWLGLLAFVVSSIDRNVERRANIASLLVLGTPARLIRASQAVQLLLPLGTALVLASAVGTTVGMAYLAVSGLQEGLYVGGLYASLAILLLSAFLAAGSGFILLLDTRATASNLRRG